MKPLNQKAWQLIGAPAPGADDAAAPGPIQTPERDLTGGAPLPPLRAAAEDDGRQHLVEGYAFNECCPSFAPGWEVDDFEAVDPCPWQTDLALCYSTCFWTAQVPDNLAGSPSGDPNWLDRCGRIQNDWRNLCVIPDTK